MAVLLPLHTSRALSDAVLDLDAAWTEACKFLGGSINAIPTSNIGEPSEINLGVDATDHHLRKVLTTSYQGKCGSKLKQAVDQFIIKKKATLPTGLESNCQDNEIQRLQVIDKIGNEAVPNHLHELPTSGVVETTFDVQPQQKSVEKANDGTTEATYGAHHADISISDAQDGTKKATHQDVCVDLPLPQEFSEVVSGDKHDTVSHEVGLFKKAVLSSHNIVNNDFLAKDLIRDNHCVKCDGGGALLVCSGISCRLTVHESCLATPYSLEDDDNFYCPFCAYTQACAMFEKAMEKYFMARKACIAFSSKYRLCQKKQEQTIVEASSKPVEERKVGNTDCSLNCSESRILSGALETSPSTKKDICDRRKDGQGLNISDTQHPCMQNIEVVDTIGMQNKQKKVIPEVLSEPVEERNMGMPPSKKHIKHRRPAKRYATLVNPYARRTSLHWTNEEEDILKELVHRHQKSNRQYIPWTQILEDGGNKFHKTRTPIDLKDKWRNILKKCSIDEKSAA